MTDLQTAASVKVSANVFLANKISCIKVVSEVYEVAYVGFTLLVGVFGYDSRIGRQCLNASLGFCGGCLPKDICTFMACAGKLRANQVWAFLCEVDSVDMWYCTLMVKLISTAYAGDQLETKVAVFDSASQPGCDHMTDLSALNVSVGCSSTVVR
ncbi:hypothetical protein [Mycobacterium lepromatosis]|uniref:hypothetical protein n=1 Tax=Mycobacterium lepromatosis TaxID=480418 RepID=UPI00067936A6|nr:hypothetical protein [Mycobacterium lepromatosis]